MNKIRIIDLLNKIANGEEIPKKFRLKESNFKDLYFEYNKKYNCYDLIGENFKSGCYVFGYGELNEEVEIIKEETKPLTKKDVEALGYACGEIRKCFENGWNKSLENKPFKEGKKIEKLELVNNGSENSYALLNEYGTKCGLTKHSKIMCDKINEIIDYLMEDNK